MQSYQSLLKEFLMGWVYDYRTELQYSQERMAEALHISPRSYVDLEHGKYFFSASTFIFFLSVLPEEESLRLLKELREFIERIEQNDSA